MWLYKGSMWPEKEICDARNNICGFKEERFCRKRNDMALSGNDVALKRNGVAFKRPMWPVKELRGPKTKKCGTKKGRFCLENVRSGSNKGQIGPKRASVAVKRNETWNGMVWPQRKRCFFKWKYVALERFGVTLKTADFALKKADMPYKVQL
jgi:hypothetical protein